MVESGDNGNVMRHRVEQLEKENEKLRRQLEKEQERLQGCIDKNEERIQSLEISMAGMTERLTVFQLAQGVFTTIAATVAAVWGRLG